MVPSQPLDITSKVKSGKSVWDRRNATDTFAAVMFRDVRHASIQFKCAFTFFFFFFIAFDHLFSPLSRGVPSRRFSCCGFPLVVRSSSSCVVSFSGRLFRQVPGARQVYLPAHVEFHHLDGG